MKYVRYGVEVCSFFNAKWGRIDLRINKFGKLQLSACPSLQPGVMPEGMEKGRIKAGTKIFDYSKKVIVSLELEDCIKIRDFFSDRDINSTVPIYRNSDKFKKNVLFRWIGNEKTGDVSNCSLTFKMSDLTNGTNVDFKLPISLTKMDELVTVIESYTNTYAMIRLFAMAESDNFSTQQQSKPRTRNWNKEDNFSDGENMRTIDVEDN